MSKQPRERDRPRSHVFDGIFEYDNDLPRWWVVMFIVTIVFSVGYIAWYHSGLFPAQSLEQEYAATLAESRAAAASSKGQEDAFDFKAVTGDAAVLASAKETFTTMCSPCHGAAGQGVVGPNLTDDFWIHGATPKDLEVVIDKGVLDKGMPGWGEILGRDKIRQIVAYIMTIQGTNPADAKAPQGDSGHLQ